MSVSAFQQLFSDMIRSGGDFSKVSNNKKPIKCYVKESFPHFLVTDNYFYVAAYFTKKAVDDFKSRHSNTNITDLKSRVVTISDWTLEMNRVNSSDVFTSYGGIEVRLVVKAFSVQAKSDITLSRHPVNIFRDDSIIPSSKTITTVLLPTPSLVPRPLFQRSVQRDQVLSPSPQDHHSPHGDSRMVRLPPLISTPSSSKKRDLFQEAHPPQEKPEFSEDHPRNQRVFQRNQRPPVLARPSPSSSNPPPQEERALLRNPLPESARAEA